MATSAMKNNAPPGNPPPGEHLADWVVQSGVVKEVLSELDYQVRKRKQKRRRSIKTASAALMVGIGLLWLVPYLRETDTLTTPSAHRQTVRLADGSQAELNARTSLKTDFRYGRRSVLMERGEAFFSVAKDPAHPFRVTTPSGTIQVTGTEFNVHLSAAGFAEVTLLAGSVQVTSESTVRHLSPGQQVRTQPDATVRALEPKQIERVVSWRQGRAVFDGDTLASGASRFADYHGITITVAPDVASLRMGGSYLLADLPEFLEALPKALPVQVTRRAEGSYLISAR